ncbi:hypothetical protein [Derxia gummosa]|uniref:DUF2214 domain-containing protein n=1 Tax=Derxia gummosa DSM 723 TaxID=1121388 RepID=A0A8B6X9D4_9BURK|nr:hypothetical protein [Derxia gummosa]
MTTLETLDWLQNTPVAHAISKSNHLVGAALQVAHVLGFLLLLAALLLGVLRVLGLAFGRAPAAPLLKPLRPLLWLGLAAAAASGALMFVSAPALYFYKPVFLYKLGLLLLAAAVQGLLFQPLAARVEAGRPAGALARGVALLSLGLWLAVAAAGRAIGFV